MSFIGIFRTGNELVALADSKATVNENGRPVHDINRRPEKLFLFNGGVLLTCGCNEILYSNVNRLFSKKLYVEDLVREHLQKEKAPDGAFFQNILLKMSSNPSNTDPVCFLVGRKIRQGQYCLELHKIGVNYHLEQLAGEQESCLFAGDPLYTKPFEQMSDLSRITSGETLRKTAVERLTKLIECYDQVLPYNYVGKPVRSYLFR